MAITWRRGFFRLIVVLWLLGAALLLWERTPNSAMGTFLAAAQLARTLALWSAALTVCYVTILWVVAGFGIGVPRTAMLVGLSGAFLAGSLAAHYVIEKRVRDREEALARALGQRVREQEEGARPRKEKERESALVWRLMIEGGYTPEKLAEIQQRTKFVAKRTAEILRTYPFDAEDLEFESRGSAKPRRIGSDDDVRRDPETAPEYLRECAANSLRRRCAETLVEAEHELGVSFQPELDAYNKR